MPLRNSEIWNCERRQSISTGNRLYVKHQLNVVNLKQNHGLVTRQEFPGALKNQLFPALHVNLHNQRGIVFELERIQGNSWNRPAGLIWPFSLAFGRTPSVGCS
jgi:hypothetical protein